MSHITLQLTDTIHDYLHQVGLRESLPLKHLREKTALREDGVMQITPEQGQFMALLVKLLQAKSVIEVGVFTGYSSLAMAEALPDDGRIVACDINEDSTAIAIEHWKMAGIAHKIDLRIAPAEATLTSLIEMGLKNSVDLIFIDADKPAYDEYYELGLQLLKSGGVILLDNMLWGGTVADPDVHDECTDALRQLNVKIHQDQRVDMVLLPLGDGVSIVRKK